MDKEDFKEAEKDEKVILLGRNDLYLCGKWLEMRKFGTFRCQKCRKLFPLPPKNKKGGAPKKYCDNCAKLVRNGKKDAYFCLDCGKKIEYNSVTHRIHKRCATCESRHVQDLKNLYQKKYKEKNKPKNLDTDFDI